MNIDEMCLGNDVVSLNPFLVERMRLDQDRVDNILNLHKQRHSILESMEIMSANNDVGRLIFYALVHRDNQFELQSAWGFPLDDSWHDWFEVPGCTCPRMDNRDRKGTHYQVINGTCPIHTSEVWIRATDTIDALDYYKQLEKLDV